MALPIDNLAYPVFIEIGSGSGSGFYFRTDKKIFLVTALHILYEIGENKQILRNKTLKLTSYYKNSGLKDSIELTVNLAKTKIRKNDSKDIVLVELAAISTKDHAIKWLDCVTKEKSSKKSGTIVVAPPRILKKFEDVAVSNDVYILGYPNSLGIPDMPQTEPKKPLLRKGIVAGKNVKNETIILDCPAYFGNSGGVAIEVDNSNFQNTKFQVIGVVSQYIPFVEKLKSIQHGYINQSFENSGYSVVIPVDTIIELTTEPPSPENKKS